MRQILLSGMVILLGGGCTVGTIGNAPDDQGPIGTGPTSDSGPIGNPFDGGTVTLPDIGQTCEVAQGCKDGLTCSPTTLKCEVTMVCNQVAVPAERIKPNVYIVMDRTGSMGYSAGATTRWQAAKMAVQQVVNEYSATVRFGVVLFPNCQQTNCSVNPMSCGTATANLPAACAPGEVKVTPEQGEQNPQSVPGAFSSITESQLCEGANYPNLPGHQTSIGITLKKFAETTTFDTSRKNIVLLVSDMAESFGCHWGNQDPDAWPDGVWGVAGTPAYVGAQALYAKGVETYPVGFGTTSIAITAERDAAIALANKIAKAGAGGAVTGYSPAVFPATMVNPGNVASPTTCGRPANLQGTCNNYLPANDLAQLRAVLTSIAQSAQATWDCDYNLTNPLTDLPHTWVYFNDQPAGISQDPTNGWTYEAATKTLRFNGASCNQLKSNMVTDLDIVVGCPGPIAG